MDAGAFFKQGIEFREGRQWPEAIGAFRQAVVAAPGDVEAHYFLAMSLDEAGFSKEAITIYQRAIVLDPKMAKAFSNLGGLLASLGQVEEAIAVCRRAIELEPKLPEAYNNLGNAMDQAGQAEAASECYRKAAVLGQQKPYFASNYLYSLYFHPRATPEIIVAEHRIWNRKYGEPFRSSVLPHENDRSPDRPLRVGYVFPINHCHPAFIPPLLLNHNRARIRIFCYSHLVLGDAVTARLQECAEGWRMVRGLSDADLAAQVRADEIDILVDLSLHMGGSRLVAFAQKPAPIQVAYLAYPGTTGLWSMDYRLTDAWLDPPGVSDGQYTEKSIRLPRTFACYDPTTQGPLPSDSSSLGSQSLVFGCLNNFAKVNDYVLGLWSRVLLAVPGSRLKLLAPSELGRRSVLDRLSRLSVDRSRVDFVGKLSRQLYMEEYRRIDICLDTLPYCGHTTTLDALWMGCPAITRVGSMAAGRAGWSVYNNLNLTELAAHDDDQFVRIAVELAGDRARRAELRRTLRDRLIGSPVMDGPAFARDVEAVYRQMWLNWI